MNIAPILRPARAGVVLFLAALGNPLACSAAVTNLTPVADTSLFEPAPGNNLGAQTYLPCGLTSGGLRTRALLRFNLAAAIPAGSTINSATLNLPVSLANGAGSTFHLHRLLVPWTEGTGAGLVIGGNVGAAANPGEVTWANRVHPATPWGAPGAQASTDFASTLSGSATMSTSALSFTGPGLVADAQLWLNQPATNHGWLIRHSTETVFRSASRLDSRESANPPTLTVDYTPPAPPTLTLFNVAASGPQFRFTFNGQAGQAYIVEGRTNLTAGWSTVTNIPALPASAPVSITNALSGSQRYFRVRTP